MKLCAWWLNVGVGDVAHAMMPILCRLNERVKLIILFFARWINVRCCLIWLFLCLVEICELFIFAIKRGRDAMHEWLPMFISMGQMTFLFCLYLLFPAHPVVCWLNEIEMYVMTRFYVDFQLSACSFFLSFSSALFRLDDRFIRYSECIRQLLIASSLFFSRCFVDVVHGCWHW